MNASQIVWPGNVLRRESYPATMTEGPREHFRWEHPGGVEEGSDAGIWERAVEAMKVFSHFELVSAAKDPRLAGLPEPLRLKAAEFLTLHQAWGTEFEASDIDGQLYLQWRLPKCDLDAIEARAKRLRVPTHQPPDFNDVMAFTREDLPALVVARAESLLRGAV